ncbi:MAG: hypothetical protein ABSD72_01605 [Terracidiphilus sp.]|jgi:hypothetical protein
MEISPVAGIRIAPMVRPREADLGLTDIYQVERSSRTGDETYSPSVAKAASGFEDDEDTLDELEDDVDAESRPQSTRDGKVSRFA